jgi:hypothetical protein
MGCARGAKGVLHALGNARVVAEQNTREERGLRFRKDVGDDVLGMSLERIEPSERRKALIAREHRHARARHDGIHALASEILLVVKLACIGRRLKFAFRTHTVAVAEIGERRRLDEDESAHGSRYTFAEIGDEEMVRLDAQVGVGVARVRLGDDDAFNGNSLLLVVVCGKRSRVKARLREVVTERTQNCGERENENPTRPGRTPGEDGAHNGDDGRNAERKRRQYYARSNPDADEPGDGEGNERRCHAVILSLFGIEPKIHFELPLFVILGIAQLLAQPKCWRACYRF